MFTSKQPQSHDILLTYEKFIYSSLNSKGGGSMDNNDTFLIGEGETYFVLIRINI